MAATPKINDMYKGEYQKISFLITDANGVAKSLSGDTVRIRVKEEETSSTYLQNDTADIEPASETGRVVAEIPAATSDTFPVGKRFGEIFWEPDNDEDTMIWKGSFEVFKRL
jgi:hypothetical protein